MTTNLEVSELLLAKFCHDMSGPVGAINNGVELLKDPNADLHKESVELIDASAKEAVARLIFFRNAYGNNRSQSGMSLNAIKDMVNNFYASKSLKFIWPETHGEAATQLLNSDMAKLLLNLVLIVAGALIQGGTITIKIKNNKKDFGIKVEGEGKTVKLQEYIVQALGTASTAPDSKNIQAVLTRMLVKQAGCNITTGVKDNYIEIIVT